MEFDAGVTMKRKSKVDSQKSVLKAAAKNYKAINLYCR